MGKKNKIKKLEKRLTKLRSSVNRLKERFRAGNLTTKELWYQLSAIINGLNLKQFAKIDFKQKTLSLRRWQDNSCVESETIFFGDLGLQDIKDDDFNTSLRFASDYDLEDLKKVEVIQDELNVGKPYNFVIRGENAPTNGN